VILTQVELLAASNEEPAKLNRDVALRLMRKSDLKILLDKDGQSENVLQLI
jgi:hypothetical protein